MKDNKQIPFNSPLETGIRSLTILLAAHPSSYDIDRLVELDYLVVHSGDADGPESLHVALPMRAGELLVRRKLIEKGLLLMSSKGLVARRVSEKGFSYIASESASPFLSSFTSEYSRLLVERAEWAVKKYQNMKTSEIRKLTHEIFENWTSQFVSIDRPGGE